MEDAQKIPLPANLSLSSNPLAHKLNQILATSFLDADIKAALDVLERKAPSRSSGQETDLGADISMQILQTNMSVLDDYKRLTVGMRAVKQDLDAMRLAVDKMKGEASTVKAASSQLLVQAAFLKEQRAHVYEKRQVLQAFERKFTLQDHHMLHLSSPEPVNDTFFEALERVKCIYDDCHLLLSTDTQTAGKEIMDAMSTHLDTGFAKLHRWTLRELSSTVSGAAEANVILRRALLVLSERATLYESCLDHVSQSRQRVLANDFAQALTRGREGSRPLLAASDDPMRFVNDVLAYLHQAVASEKEVLDVILGSASNRPSEAEQARRDSAARLLSPPALEDLTFRFESIHSTLVDRNFGLVMKPLQQNIDKVVMSTQDTLAAYKSAILIRFYRDLLARVLLPEAQLLASLKSLEQSLTHWYLQFTRTDLAAVKALPPQADAKTLKPPAFLLSTLQDTGAVLEVLDSSFLDPQSKQADFTEMFGTILKQALELCMRMAANDLDQPAASIFLLHCAAEVAATLTPFGSVAEPQRVAAEEVAHRTQQALVVEQHDFLLRETGLDRYLEALEACYVVVGLPSPMRAPEESANSEATDEADEDRLIVATKKSNLRRELASRQETFSQAALTQFDETLDKRLRDLPDLLAERLARLNLNGFAGMSANDINQDALSRFARDYGILEHHVVDHIEFGRSLLSRNERDVRELW